MKDNVSFIKSKKFAVRIINLYKHLKSNKREYEMSRQLLRSGTSIGANLAEANYGISDKDFLSKLFISLKECSETKYWLEILHEAEYLSDSEFDSINKDCIELLKILTASAKTLSEKLRGQH